MRTSMKNAFTQFKVNLWCNNSFTNFIGRPYISDTMHHYISMANCRFDYGITEFTWLVLIFICHQNYLFIYS